MPNPLLIDIPESLVTERLLLRPPRRGDGPVLHEAIVESLPALRQFLASLPWVAEEQTHQSAELFCRNSAANVAARKDLPYLLFQRDTGRLLGACGLHRTQWEVPKTEIGYWLRTSEAGRGYASEAVHALVDAARTCIGAVRIEIITDEHNLASRKVAERCGFQLEGVLRNERRDPQGVLRNTCVYALLTAAA